MPISKELFNTEPVMCEKDALVHFLKENSDHAYSYAELEQVFGKDTMFAILDACTTGEIRNKLVKINGIKREILYYIYHSEDD